jgi:hypothetical protein
LDTRNHHHRSLHFLGVYKRDGLARLKVPLLPPQLLALQTLRIGLEQPEVNLCVLLGARGCQARLKQHDVAAPLLTLEEAVLEHVGEPRHAAEDSPAREGHELVLLDEHLFGDDAGARERAVPLGCTDDATAARHMAHDAQGQLIGAAKDLVRVRGPYAARAIPSWRVLWSVCPAVLPSIVGRVADELGWSKLSRSRRSAGLVQVCMLQRPPRFWRRCASWEAG